MELNLTSGRISVEINVPDDAIFHCGAALQGSRDDILNGLQNPLGLPILPECVVPGDRVVLVVDPETPGVVELVTLVWQQFQESGNDELDTTLLLPHDVRGERWKQLLDELPVHVRNQVAVHVYDPADETQRRYLANSAAGERIYLSHYLTDADLVVTIGALAFDATYGCRGTNSAIYPAFSEPDAIAKYRLPVSFRQSIESEGSLRDLVDEIGWLLATQFSVQVVAGAGEAQSRVLCGAPDQVMKAGLELLEASAKMQIEEQVELAIVTLPGQVVGSWKQLGAALESARHLVGDGGRIVVIADLPETPGAAVDAVVRAAEPQELLASLRSGETEDALEAIQIIESIAHTRTFVLSELGAAFVEDLGMLPLANAEELQRLIDAADSVVVVTNANYVRTQVAQPTDGIN